MTTRYAQAAIGISMALLQAIVVFVAEFNRQSMLYILLATLAVISIHQLARRSIPANAGDIQFVLTPFLISSFSTTFLVAALSQLFIGKVMAIASSAILVLLVGVMFFVFREQRLLGAFSRQYRLPWITAVIGLTLAALLQILSQMLRIGS